MSTLQSLAQLTTSQIVTCLILGIAVAALAGTGSLLIGRKSSGTRFAIWFAGLIAIASLFFVSRPLVPGATAAHGGSAEISLAPVSALYIFAAWAFFAFIGLARIARGLWRVRLLKKACVPLE